MANILAAIPELLGKLGSEHFSAEVQGKHIALLKEQFTILERENAKLIISLEKSELKNQILKSENKNLKNEAIQLKKKIEAFEKPTHDNSFPKEQILILKCLSKIPTDKMISTKQIMEACKLTEHSALYHLQELEEMSMIESNYINDEPYWLLDHDGRGYLIKNKLMA